MFVYSTFVKLRIKNSYLLYILDWLLFKYCRVFHLFSDIYKRSPNVNFLSVFLVESRFAILFSKGKGTGKTASLLFLGKLEGVPSSNSEMALAVGDGAKTGTTMYLKTMDILPNVRIVKSILKNINSLLLIVSFCKTLNYLIIMINALAYISLICLPCLLLWVIIVKMENICNFIGWNSVHTFDIFNCYRANNNGMWNAGKLGGIYKTFEFTLT